jgi:hypothetical protein
VYKKTDKRVTDFRELPMSVQNLDLHRNGYPWGPMSASSAVLGDYKATFLAKHNGHTYISYSGGGGKKISSLMLAWATW